MDRRVAASCSGASASCERGGPSSTAGAAKSRESKDRLFDPPSAGRLLASCSAAAAREARPAASRRSAVPPRRPPASSSRSAPARGVEGRRPDARRPGSCPAAARSSSPSGAPPASPRATLGASSASSPAEKRFSSPRSTLEPSPLVAAARRSDDRSHRRLASRPDLEVESSRPPDRDDDAGRDRRTRRRRACRDRSFGCALERDVSSCKMAPRPRVALEEGGRSPTPSRSCRMSDATSSIVSSAVLLRRRRRWRGVHRRRWGQPGPGTCSFVDPRVACAWTSGHRRCVGRALRSGATVFRPVARAREQERFLLWDLLGLN